MRAWSDTHQHSAARWARQAVCAGVTGLLFLALAGCWGGSSDPVVQAQSATIGVAGGTVTGPDGAQVVIPPGALTQDTEIRIARTAEGAPTDFPHDAPPSGATYEFTPHDIEFLRPVTIRIPAGSTVSGPDARVLSSSPTMPWHLLQATAANGFLTWENTTFSFYNEAFGCTHAADDPYPCVGIGADVSATSTPSTALTEFGNLAYQSNFRQWYFRGSPQVQLTATFVVARDCIDAKLDMRQFLADGRVTLTHPAVNLSPASGIPGADAKSVGTTNVLFTLADTPDRTRGFSFVFSCARAYQYSNTQVRTTLTEGAYFEPNPEPQAPSAPAITQQPVDITVAPGGDAAFTVTADGVPAPTAQWQRSNDGGASWAAITGATGLSYTLTAAAITDTRAQFRVVLTNSQGTVTSQGATLTVVAPVTAQWQTAAALRQPDGLTATDVKVAAGANGRLIAVWVDEDGLNVNPSLLRSSRFTAGAGWSAPETVVSVPPSTFSVDRQIKRSSVALQSDGQAVVVYSSLSNGKRSIWTSEQPLGGAWSTPSLVETSDTGDASEPRLVVDGQDTATAVWIDDTTASTMYPTLYASRKPAGGTWSTPVSLGYTLNPVPRIAANARGDVVVGLGVPGIIFGFPAAAIYRAGTGWTAPQVFAQRVSLVTDVAINDSGLAAATMVIDSQALVARSAAGGVWTAPEVVSSSNDNAGPPTVAVTAAGTVQVAWATAYGGGTPVLWYAEAPAGGGFTAPAIIVANSFLPSGPLMRIDAVGNTVVVLQAYSGSYYGLYGLRRPAGGSWGSPVLIETQTSTASTPGSITGGGHDGYLAVSPNGDAAVVWLEGNTSPFQPWANAFLH